MLKHEQHALWQVFRHEPYNIKVDVYSFAMILYQLLEHCAPFAGMDPVEAAQRAALQNVRPSFRNLDSKTKPMPVSHSQSCAVIACSGSDTAFFAAQNGPRASLYMAPLSQHV